MKKSFTLFLSVLLCVAIVFSLTACKKDEVQGLVKDKDGKTGTLWIGNTAASSGTYATVGVPFNYGLEAYLYQYNTNGGYRQDDVTYNVRLKTYDDAFVGATGLSYTQKLVEEDKVFALVGHFGTNTVAATLEYIEEKGVPMFYAATGISALYNVDAKDNAARIMPVQPIYDGEGSVLLATAFASVENGGLGGTKVGVLYTDDDAGLGLYGGIMSEAAKLGKTGDVVYQQVSASATEANTQVTAIKNAGCDVVIIASNQGPLATIGASLKNSAYSGKMITSYVSSNTVTMGTLAQQGIISEEREMYATGWLDIVDHTDTAELLGYSSEYWDFARCMNAYEAYKTGKTGDDASTVTSPYAANAYAMAGYIAAHMFCEVLDRVEESDDKLTWETFVEYAEKEKVNIPMGEYIDFSGGKRTGVTGLSLTRYTHEYTTEGEGSSAYYNSLGTLVRGLKSLEELEAGISGK